MKSIFSSIVILSVVSYVVWFFMPLAWEYMYDYETLSGLNWVGYGAKLDMDGPIPYLLGVIYLVCSLGLLFFKSWARTLFLALTIINILSAPFWGLNVQGAYDVIPGYIVNLCDGAILSLAYLSSLSGEFKKGN